MSPKNSRFYEVVVDISIEDSKGRVKKTKSKYLIDAVDTNQAEKNTMKLMEGTMYDWEIYSITQSKISEVYVDSLDDEE